MKQLIDIKRNIDLITNKLRTKKSEDAKKIYTDYLLFTMSPSVNEWNKAAVNYVIEKQKLPSLRNRLVYYSLDELNRISSVPDELSTNDWNGLAISKKMSEAG